ncbi:MAG: lactonase family protein [Rectinemataceae bacterium]|nr:lactonase family protein [Rectinemataceae bacterium]
MEKHVTVFTGTYTEPGYRGKGEGIYSCSLDLESGSLALTQKVLDVANPSYIACDPARERLYCVNELREYKGKPSGAVTAFSVERNTHLLKKLNSQASEGMDPCHIIVAGSGRHALVSNYSSGSVCVLPIAPDGRLGKAVQLIRHKGTSINKKRQTGPHVHSLFFDPEQRYAFACDLGIDRLVTYRYDGDASEPLNLVEERGVSIKPGAGPRHCSFHPSGKYCYLINELDSTIEVLRYHSADGRFMLLQIVSALPEASAAANLCAAIRVSPDGKFLYASNRGHDSIIVYRIDRDTGLLTYVVCEPSGGRTPRDFIVDPSGTFLLVANQDSDKVAVFRIDAGSGKLAKISEIGIPTPVCIRAYIS